MSEQHPKPCRIGPVTFVLAMMVIMAVALWIRLSGLNWDEGHYLHPDERFMTMVTVDVRWPQSIFQYFDAATSPLNPYNSNHGTFIYGTFPLFLDKAISTLTGTTAYGNVHLAGRVVSAMADTGTVMLTGLIARRFFGRMAGLLASLFLAFTALSIQSAHFYTVDAISVFFALGAFYTLLRATDDRSYRWFVLAGVMMGLAGASKPNFLISLAFLGLPVAEQIRRRGWGSLIPQKVFGFSLLLAVPLAFFVAFWTFRIFQPYAFTGPGFFDIRLNPQWLNDLKYWQQAQQGLIDVKSSVQWVGRTPVVYILQNMIQWGMGVPLGIVSLVALLWGSVQLVRAARWPSWWMLGMAGWSLAQIALYGLNQAQAQRYLIMVYPFLIVLAAGWLVELSRRAPSLPWLRSLPRWANPGVILTVITVAYTMFYGTAFATLYTRPLSRMEASAWIFDNIPPGSVTTAEYWDDALPIPLPGRNLDYQIITLDLYDAEGPTSFKVSKLVNQITQADYIILSSNRVIASVPQQPARYPVANRYYEMLLNGELGFDQVAAFQQMPELFGIRFNDVNAEETLTVYEHPLVRIFKKNDSFDPDTIYTKLMQAQGYGGVTYLPGDPVPEQLWLTPSEQQTLTTHGSWRDAFSLTGWVANHPIISWYLALQVIALAGLPLAWRLVRRSAGAGYPLAKLVGLAGVTMIAWWVGWLQLLPFDRGMIIVSWLALLMVGLLVTGRQLGAMLRDFRTNLGWIVGTELVFLLSLVGFGWLRSFTGAILAEGSSSTAGYWLTMFTGTVRSATFPPVDLWASGGVQHTPYLGWLPWALVTRLLGLAPSVGFTLIAAGIAGVSTTGLWWLGGTLLARIAPGRRGAGVAALLVPLLAIGGGAVGNHELTTGWVFTTPFTDLVTNASSPATTTLPFIVLLLAGGVGLLLPSDDRSWWAGYSRTDLAVRAMLGVGLGAVMASALWGVYLAAPFVVLAIAVAALIRHGWTPAWRLVRAIVMEIAGVGAVAVAMAVPWVMGYVNSPRNMTTMPTLTFAVLTSQIGPVLSVVLVLLLLRVAEAYWVTEQNGERAVLALMVLAVVLVGAGAVVLDMPVVAAMAVVLAGGVLALLDQRSAWRLMADAMLVTAGVAMAVWVVLPISRDPFNVAVSHQMGPAVWLLFTVMIGLGLGTICLAERRTQRILAGLMTFAVIALLAVGPVGEARTLVETSAGRSLDATALVGDAPTLTPEREAARWLMTHADGMPVILEAQGASQGVTARFSMISGLPTVLGWTGPETVMRPGWQEVNDRRVQAINQVYGSTGDFASIRGYLDQYHVEYIIVGTQERAVYGDLGLAKFAEAEAAGAIERVYDEQGVVIYRYRPDPALAEQFTEMPPLEIAVPAP